MISVHEQKRLDAIEEHMSYMGEAERQTFRKLIDEDEALWKRWCEEIMADPYRWVQFGRSRYTYVASEGKLLDHNGNDVAAKLVKHKPGPGDHCLKTQLYGRGKYKGNDIYYISTNRLDLRITNFRHRPFYHKTDYYNSLWVHLYVKNRT